MEDTNALFMIPIVAGPIIVVAGAVMFFFPPKKINGLYGYRTSSSMKNKKRWEFAQRYSSKEIMKWGGIYTLLSLLGLLVNPGETIGTGIGLALLIITIAIAIYRVEKAIKRKFGKSR